MKWEKVAIKDICTGIYDGPHATPPLSDTGAIFLGISNFNNGRLDFSDIRYISEDDLPKWTKRVIPQKDDIVFSYEATLNLYAIIPEGFRGCLGRRMALLRVDKTKADYKFLYYYFYSDAWRATVNENIVLGATVDRIPLIKFPDFPVELPPLETQHRIADILSAYDDLIENNQKQIKLLEETAQRLYKEWFVDLRFPGHENTKIVDGVPEGWKKNCAEKFFEITIGKTPPRTEKRCFTTGENGISWVSIADMGNSGMFVLNTAENLTEDAIKQYNVKVIPKNTVLLSFKLTVGRVAIAPTDICTNEAIAHFKGRRECEREYTYCYLKNFHYDELGSTSSISKAVNSKIIKAMPFIMPSEKLLKEYSSKTKDAFDLIICKQKIDNNLKITRDRILHKLMSGEVEV